VSRSLRPISKKTKKTKLGVIFQKQEGGGGGGGGGGGEDGGACRKF